MSTRYPVQTATVDGETYDEASVRAKLAALTANPDFNGRELANLADPSAAQHAATKHYVDTAPGLAQASPPLQTADATETKLDQVAAPNDKTLFVETRVVGTKSDFSAGAGWTLRGAFRNNAGVVTQIGATDVDFVVKDDAGWGDASLVINGTDVEIHVVGKAATTINWAGQTEVEAV